MKNKCRLTGVIVDMVLESYVNRDGENVEQKQVILDVVQGDHVNKVAVICSKNNPFYNVLQTGDTIRVYCFFTTNFAKLSGKYITNLNCYYAKILNQNQ